MFLYTVNIQNQVNKQQGKPILSYDSAYDLIYTYIKNFRKVYDTKYSILSSTCQASLTRLQLETSCIGLGVLSLILILIITVISIKLIKNK